MDYQTEAIQQFAARVDPDARPFGGTLTDVPEHWHDYAEKGIAERLFGLRQEMAVLRRYLPEAADAVQQKAVDVCLLETSTLGVVRVIVVMIRGALYCSYSGRPGASPVTPAAAALMERAPRVLAWIYTDLMDGLTDLNGFGGFKPLSLITSVEDEIDTYAEASWYEDFIASRNPANVVEIFASGGGAYLLVDLDDQQGDDPVGYLVDVGNPDPPKAVALYSYLDAWTAIGQSE
jgi:hypothetical protein